MRKYSLAYPKASLPCAAPSSERIGSRKIRADTIIKIPAPINRKKQ
jgi:hypothetical protein